MPEEGGEEESREGRRGCPRRRAWRAWLVSALFHGLLALVIRRGGWTWTAPLAGSRAALELEVIDVAAPPPEPMAASPPASRPAAGATKAPARGSPRGRGLSAAPGPVSAEQRRAPETAPVDGASPSGDRGPTWMGTRPTDEAPAASSPGASGAVHPPQLSLDGLSLSARDRLAGPAPPGAAAMREPRISVDRLRVARERDEDAVANVRVGRVDPFLHDYVRDARVRFEEGARHIAEQLPLDAQRTAESWVRGYGARLAEVNAQAAAARNGARRDSDAPGGDPPERLIDRHPDLLGGFDEATRAADAGSVERHVTVCVDVAPGRDTTVAVKRESRDPALDQLAREAFARAIAARPAPADAHAATACYDLRIRAFRMPPLPVISCGIDKDGPTCTWPFKKITSVTVHLQSVDYPADHADQPALLRRPH